MYPNQCLRTEVTTLPLPGLERNPYAWNMTTTRSEIHHRLHTVPSVLLCIVAQLLTCTLSINKGIPLWQKGRPCQGGVIISYQFGHFWWYYPTKQQSRWICCRHYLTRWVMLWYLNWYLCIVSTEFRGGKHLGSKDIDSQELRKVIRDFLLHLKQSHPVGLLRFEYHSQPAGIAPLFAATPCH